MSSVAIGRRVLLIYFISFFLVFTGCFGRINNVHKVKDKVIHEGENQDRGLKSNDFINKHTNLEGNVRNQEWGKQKDTRSNLQSVNTNENYKEEEVESIERLKDRTHERNLQSDSGKEFEGMKWNEDVQKREKSISKRDPFEIEGYEEAKEKLREIFASSVLPDESIDNDDYESIYGSDDFDNNRDNIINEYDELNKEYNSFLQRRRGLVTDTKLRNEMPESDLAFEIERDEQTINNNDHKTNYRHDSHHGHENTQQFMNEWVVQLTGGPAVAAAVAKDLGYEFLGQVGHFDDVYRLVKRDHPSIHKRAAPHLTSQLNIHAEVKWAEQQFSKQRSKRSILPQVINLWQEDYDPYKPHHRTKRIEMEEEMERELLEEKGTRKKRELRDEKNKNQDKELGIMVNDQKTEDFHILKWRSDMAANALKMEKMFNDELWDHQWYLFDTRTRSDLPKLDLQVVSVWKAGITGKGVRILVLDDGLEWRHTDIIQNYDPEISYDYNDNDNDPTPRYDFHLSNSHGTKCAGEISMVPNNRKCGVGVAFGASIGGVRMLDGPVSDVVEGSSLGNALDKVDIITCSWGPTDDGRRVEGPGRLAQMAIHKGITQGRDGKGIIYVWAAGNGGSAGDDCNCDGYTSSIYTLSISSASETGLFPWYGERCSSTLATAYSSGAYTDQKIATTDLNNGCTDKFSGTSAAAPLAAGILALALEVNPNLTWRDMQHAVVWSSEWGSLSHNSGWKTNSLGLKYNSRFGFGLLNADGLIQTVRNWTSVPEKTICTVKSTSRSSSLLKTGESITVKFEDAGCAGQNNELRSLEHVQIITNIDYTRRGSLSIGLISPSGTETQLLSERVDDDSTKGFHNWYLMSVHTWGEDPRGTWILNVTDRTNGNESGVIGNITLVLHGTKTVPKHMEEERVYRISTSFLEDQDDSERHAKDVGDSITAEKLKTLTWQQLVDLLSRSTRSTFSEDDVKMLLEENRLEKAIRSIQSDPSDDGNKDSDWLKILNKEFSSRKYELFK